MFPIRLTWAVNMRFQSQRVSRQDAYNCSKIGSLTSKCLATTAVQEQLSALRESKAKMQDELKQERGRSASVIRQLGAFEREILALKAQAKSTATTQEALRQEKENTAAALRDVHTLKKQIADVGAHTEFVPAALLFQTTPVLLKPSTHTFQGGAELTGEPVQTTISRTVRLGRCLSHPRSRGSASCPMKQRHRLVTAISN